MVFSGFWILELWFERFGGRARRSPYCWILSARPEGPSPTLAISDSEGVFSYSEMGVSDNRGP